MEIELKIPLKKENFDLFVAKTKETKKYTCFCKQDQYFSRFDSKEKRIENKEPSIRIRDLGDSKIKLFTLKRKSIEDGIEVNVEKETEIIDTEPLIDLLLICGYKVWFSKKKESCCWQQTFENISLNCELVCLNDKLHYFEVEAADFEGDKNLAINALKACIKEYGLNYDDRDERPWTEILK